MTRSDVKLPTMLAAARTGGYAVPAFNVIDVATMDGVLRAASQCRSPVIVQTAAVTARTWGPARLAAAAIPEACAAALRGQTGPGAGRDDPLASLVAIRDAARTVSLDVMARLGSAGRAEPPDA